MLTKYLVPILALVSSSTAAPGAKSGKDVDPLIVDLGAAGVYKGAYEYENKVRTYRGIPFAAPPVGDLRFKKPRALAKQNSTIIDVSDDFPGSITNCVQFGNAGSTKGPNAGVGAEDCLKLWMWVPANATKGSKLPVYLYSHGGGYQNGQSASHPHTEWVGDSQNFIAIAANYRLGLLGFWNSEASLNEGETANVGLLDARFAAEWVVKNIAAFGGDPKNIAISGQSGGGGLIKDQLVLYDGKGYSFQKAIPRSIQRSPSYRIAELTARNDAFAASVNCTTSSASKEGAKAQLACMRSKSAEQIRVAALAFAKTKDANGGTWPGWLPSIDGITLTDSSVRLYRQGKIAKVPVMPVTVTQEFSSYVAYAKDLVPATVRQYAGNISDELVDKMLRIYPAAIANSSQDTGTYQDSTHQVWSLVDDSLAKCSTAMVARAATAAGVDDVYTLRFNAPMPRADGSLFQPWLSTVHSSDNYYLENSTSTMNATVAAAAYEWRAYLSSFIRHSDPNVEKLKTSPTWYKSNSDTRYDPQMVISLAIDASAQPQYPTNSGMEIRDTASSDRCTFWLSEEVVSETRQ